MGQRFRNLRILVLLLILLFVAVSTLLSRWRTTDWNSPLWVVLYPVNADHSPVTQRYINALTRDQFTAIEGFIERERRRHQVALPWPVIIKLAPQVDERPPSLSARPSLPETVWWSLRLRFWAVTHDTFDGPGNVQLFVLFHDPALQHRLAHSHALQKGLVGVVNAFADRHQQGANQMVITHELLHTFGATDKYEASTSLPVYPYGFAEPQRAPRYPQRYAEIMGGRVPLSPVEARIPRDLDEVRVGELTAAEIRWRR